MLAYDRLDNHSPSLEFMAWVGDYKPGWIESFEPEFWV